MAQKIRSITLYNIQSWADGERQTLDLSLEDVNVIIARSETGKSVIFKIFYQMCFPDYWKYKSENNLLRRRCMEGKAIYELADGTILTFVFNHSTQHYEMKHPGEDEATIYWNAEIPEEVNRELGLIYDKDLRMILNVLIKDIPYPIIATSPQWNAKIFALVLTDTRIESGITNCREWIIETSAMVKRLTKSITIEKQVYDKYTVYDLDSIQGARATAAKLQSLATNLEGILEALGILQNAVTEHNKVTLHVKDIVCVDDLRKLSMLYRDILPQLCIVDKSLRVINSTVELDSLSSLRALCSLSTYLRDLGYSLQNLYDCEASYIRSTELVNRMSEYSQKLYTMMGAKRILLEIRSGIAELGGSMKTYTETIARLQDAESQLQNIKNQLGICPLCKTPFTTKSANPEVPHE